MLVERDYKNFHNIYTEIIYILFGNNNNNNNSTTTSNNNNNNSNSNNSGRIYTINNQKQYDLLLSFLCKDSEFFQCLYIVHRTYISSLTQYVTYVKYHICICICIYV